MSVFSDRILSREVLVHYNPNALGQSILLSFYFFSLTFPVGTDESSYWFWIWLKLICDTLRDLVPFALFAFRKPATSIKAKLLHRYFSRFFDCTNDNKSCKASHGCCRTTFFRISFFTVRYKVNGATLILE